MIQNQNSFTQSIDRLKQKLVNWPTFIRKRKLSLINIWPILLSLTLLIWLKIQFILETKIQFHHNILNLTNINPLTNWQVFYLMRLNLNVNVIPIPNFVIQFQFWIYVDSGILTRFGPNSRANTDSYTYKFYTWTTDFRKSHLIDGKRMWISIFWFGTNSWPKLTLECKLDLSIFPSQYWFLNLSFLSPSQPFIESHSIVGPRYIP